MNNIVQLKPKYNQYRKTLNSEDILDLLDKMVKFQEHRSKIGGVTSEMIEYGTALFDILYVRAETEVLRILSKSYSESLKMYPPNR